MKYRILGIIAAGCMLITTSCDKSAAIEAAPNVKADEQMVQTEAPAASGEVVNESVEAPDVVADSDDHAPKEVGKPAEPEPEVLTLAWNITVPNAEFRITNDKGLAFDVDCDGDDVFEKTGLTEHYTCVYPNAGDYRTTIRGPLAKHLMQTPKNAVPNPEGMTLETRFPAPNGYYRLTQGDTGYANYLHAIAMLPDGSPVLLFNGELKGDQDVHVAVLDIDVGNRDLQQCADAAMRLRTEYLFASDQQDKMVYHLSGGLLFSWSDWRNGSRLVKNDKGKIVMVKSASANKSYQNYRNWLDKLMMYANVDSIMKESKKLSLDELSPGDVFASRGRAYNHLIIAIDVVTAPDGDKKFLLAQSFMPAQQIEVLKNPYNPDSPWYSLSDVKRIYESGEDFYTPEWIFPAPGSNLFRMR